MSPDPTVGGRYFVWLPLVVVIVVAVLVVYRYWREWLPPGHDLYFSLFWLFG